MSSSVDHWLRRLSPRTAKEHGWIFRAWLDWLGKDDRFGGMAPDELVAFQRGAVGDDRYALLDLVQEFVGERRCRANTRRRYYSSLRSFFLHNRAELPGDRSFKIRGDVPRVVGSLSIDMFRRVVETSNPMYRTLFLCMFQAGMGVGEALYWSDMGLEKAREQLRAGERPLRIELPGRKRNRNHKPYYTFIGLDGINALEHWLEERPDLNGSIFLTARKTPMTYNVVFVYWLRRLRRLGFIRKKEKGGSETRYGKNLHELRDLFRSRWQKSGAAPEAAEFFMGHTVDPLEYNKAFRDMDYAANEYVKAEPWLNIVSEDPEKVPLRDHDKLKRMYEKKLSDLKEEILSEVLKELNAVKKLPI